MDIDTGDSPPVHSRPYTLPLKHYEWVEREIESLEWAGVIKKSMSNWASPIVVVPKKSTRGEPRGEGCALILGTTTRGPSRRENERPDITTSITQD